MISRIRGASAIVLGGLVSFGLTLASAQPALATQAQPPTDWSFYVRANNTSEAYQLGYNQGSFDGIQRLDQLGGHSRLRCTDQ